MRRIMFRKLLFQTPRVLICALACSFILTTQAGIRGPGKYCGVVVFDRWDTCFLLSGPYITYIADAVKNRLRPYSGTAIQRRLAPVSGHSLLDSPPYFCKYRNTL
ncbi:MAG TPA: hypothetical protein VKH63_05050 [Candidatus Acidoferrum sp.]|jgi:hypothetical protein|nr:hypothetical protein [Candidatus Acidoferrum sp.]